MGEYMYTNPVDDSYERFRLTKKQHNTIFKYRRIRWHDKYEYYINEHGVILHKFYNIRAIMVCTVLFPLTLLLEGLMNIKDCIKDLKKMYNQKKYGYFGSDYIPSKTEMYEQIKKCIYK